VSGPADIAAGFKRHLNIIKGLGIKRSFRRRWKSPAWPWRSRLGPWLTTWTLLFYRLALYCFSGREIVMSVIW